MSSTQNTEATGTERGQVFIVFDGPPGHDSPRFVETEDRDGHGIGVDGVSWYERQDGYWTFGPFFAPRPASAGTAERQPTVSVGRDTEIRIIASSPDWFGVWISTGTEHISVVYLRRSELHALRCRLDEIDAALPQPETRP